MDDEKNKTQEIKQAFVSLDRKFEEEETARRAKNLGLAYFKLASFPIDRSVLLLISKEQAKTAGAIPFAKEGNFLKLGVMDPKTLPLQQLLKSLEQKKLEVELYVISKSSFLEEFAHYQKAPLIQLKPKTDVAIQVSSEALARLKALAQDPAQVVKISTSELMSLIFSGAIILNASDIHLEPEKKNLKLRFRVDGVLQEIASFPLLVYQHLLSRIKILSGLKLNITAKSQDGRFTIKQGARETDLRVSTLPAAHGESIVIRILGLQGVDFAIEKLGLKGRALSLIYQELKKPNGMILTTGPTGSGKTTTLFAFLNHLNKPGVEIITIEDPVEYHLSGVIQTPINRAAGMDFAGALRSVLRQDPDIIMIGEIRDYETAETACQAALTGHIVFSTLHTNDAAGAIPRILDLEVKPVTLAPALNALIAQRLLRKLCEHCREVYKPERQELARVKTVLSQIPQKAEITIPEPLVFSRSRGCGECHALGYSGRIGVFEVFVVNEQIEKLIHAQAATTEIKKAAIESGMLTMQQDGVLKALEGTTDLAEVWRVTEE